MGTMKSNNEEKATKVDPNEAVEVKEVEKLTNIKSGILNQTDVGNESSSDEKKLISVEVPEKLKENIKVVDQVNEAMEVEEVEKMKNIKSEVLIQNNADSVEGEQEKSKQNTEAAVNKQDDKKIENLNTRGKVGKDSDDEKNNEEKERKILEKEEYIKKKEMETKKKNNSSKSIDMMALTKSEKKNEEETKVKALEKDFREAEAIDNNQKTK